MRRQHEDWQRDATRRLATGLTSEALDAYERHGHVHAAATRKQARGALIDGWNRARQTEPDRTRLILTHTNAEVRDLNELARQRPRDAGELGADAAVQAERGERAFASGLATPAMDRHSTYVALSRHRDTVDQHYSRDDFADEQALARTLSRERTKDMASDFVHDFADRRGIAAPDRAEPILVRETAVQRHARAVVAIFQMQEEGRLLLPDQVRALSVARAELDKTNPHASRAILNAPTKPTPRWRTRRQAERSAPTGFPSP